MVKAQSCRITRWHFVLPLCLVISLSACTLIPLTPLATSTDIAPVTLRVYTFRQPLINQVLNIVTKAYKVKHPEVTVHIEQATDDPATQLAAMTATQSLPDIIWTIDALTPSLADAGLLLDLREIANLDPNFKLDNINPSALAQGNVANQPGLYMIPVVMDNVEMFYNVNLFKDSGVPLPGANWTWDDLIAACQSIQNAHPDVKCIDYSFFGTLDAGWWGYLVPWIKGYGGDVLTSDGLRSTLSSNKSLAGIQAYVNLWTDQQIAEPLGQDVGRSTCFVDGKCAVSFSVASGIGYMQQRIGKQFVWDVQRMPAHPDGRYTGTLTYGYGIGKDTQHRDLAWDFVKMLVDPSVQSTIARNHAGLPVLKSVLNNPAIMGGGPPANMQVFYQSSDMLIYPPAYPTRCGNLYSGMVQSVIENAVQQAIGGADVVDTFTQADLKIQTCLDSSQ